jgi:hypothetical protein
MYAVAVMPVLLAAGWRLGQGLALRPDQLLLFLLAAVLLLAWENLANDVFDADTGVDTHGKTVLRKTISRGKLIDTGALLAALKSGQIGGIAMDVYEEEEGIFFEDLSGQVLQDDELSLLLNFPNVLITAHQAFLTREALKEIASVTTRNILQLETGGNFIAGTRL